MSAASAGARVRGWCPGAHRPMASGDGLIVRVGAPMGRLVRDQVLGLCDLARHYGNGVLDLTSRANLQIRGVSDRDHPALVASLVDLGLLDPDPAAETRPSVLVTPFWQAGDRTCRLAEVLAGLAYPELPAKFGLAVDAGTHPVLGQASADIRVEAAAAGGLVVRADGASSGLAVTEDEAPDAVLALAGWFARTSDHATRRMARLVRAVGLPDAWLGTVPAASGADLKPGPTVGGTVVGVAFGRADAGDLAGLFRASDAVALRLAPGRLFLLEGEAPADCTPFISDPDDSLLAVDVCPGAPACASASVETRDLARRLAGRVRGRLHVSGCPKGCARSRPADITLVGRDGRFDLIRGGTAADTPFERGLAAAELLAKADHL